MLQKFYTAIKPDTRNRNKALNPEEEMTTAAAVDKFAHAMTNGPRACLGVTCMPGGWMGGGGRGQKLKNARDWRVDFNFRSDM